MLVRKFFFVLMAILPLFFVACDREGPMERTGERIDRSAERAGESVERGAERAGERVDNTMERERKE